VAGGFGADVTVTNLGDPVNGWRLTWSFTAGQTISQLWNGTYTQSGAQVTVTNAGWNGSIATGATANVGFNGTWNGSNPVPNAFALNGTTCTGSVTGSPSASPSPTPTSSPPAAGLPCDIYAAGGTPCVAAHSTVRALYRSYAGNLYQVRRSSDNGTRNIGVLATGGVASATSESLSVGGSKAYSLYINPRNSYWRNGSASGVPTGSAPEGMYMVTSGTHVNNGCCFDYGNSETNRRVGGAGAMDAINFSTQCWFGGCSGSGPWVQADLEGGLYPGGSQSWNPNQRAFTSRFVTATLKNNGTSRFAIKGSNAQSGSLFTLWDGALPPGYSPMKKQGAIVLGSGGDCCLDNTNLSAGTFYEGAMVSGYPSDATENAVQANIVSAGYR
jgi:non-reducing end alpha-L-arabinofuranosidase